MTDTPVWGCRSLFINKTAHYKQLPTPLLVRTKRGGSNEACASIVEQESNQFDAAREIYQAIEKVFPDTRV